MIILKWLLITKINLENTLKIFQSPLIDYLIMQFSKHGFDNIHALELLNNRTQLIDNNVFLTYSLTNKEINHILNVIE